GDAVARDVGAAVVVGAGPAGGVRLEHLSFGAGLEGEAVRRERQAGARRVAVDAGTDPGGAVPAQDLAVRALLGEREGVAGDVDAAARRVARVVVCRTLPVRAVPLEDLAGAAGVGEREGVALAAQPGAGGHG